LEGESHPAGQHMGVWGMVLGGQAARHSYCRQRPLS
jgi:hypothetical protein